MGRRTQLKPQSRIQRKSSSRNMPLFSYGKCCIQSGSVEKYSRRLNPYQRGFSVFADSAVEHKAAPIGSEARAATPAIPFSTLRRSIDASLLNGLGSLFIRRASRSLWRFVAENVAMSPPLDYQQLHRIDRKGIGKHQRVSIARFLF